MTMSNMEFQDDYTHHGLNANNVPLFKSFDSYINFPSTTLWISEILLTTFITGGSLPAAAYISSTKLFKNTPFSLIL